MSTTEFMSWYNFEPQAALELLTGMIQQYIEYDVQKFHQKHETQTEVTKRLRDQYSESRNKTATQKKHVSTAEQKRQFRQYLCQQPGFVDVHPYLWDDLKDFGMRLLKDSTDREKSEALLQKIKDLEPQIGKLKTKYGLKKDDTDFLGEIDAPEKYQQAIPSKVMSEQQHLKTSCWIQQADIDYFLLDDRIKQSSQIHLDVQELLLEALVHNNLVNEEDFLFADVKTQERSSHKLLEYIDKKKKKIHKDKCAKAESSVYDLKDLLRGSIISDSTAQTKKIVETMFGLEHAKVVEMKNGFKPNDSIPFDPTQQADIKLILLVGSDDEYDFEELVEIQIIQRINLELKKIEHKLQAFTREQESFVRRADENLKLFKSFKKAILKIDLKAADHLSSSHQNKLQSVVKTLVPQYPHLQIDRMDTIQLLDDRFTFRNGPQQAIQETLQGLYDSRESIEELKLDFNKDAVELSTFQIKFKNNLILEKYFFNTNSRINCIVNSNDEDVKQVGLDNGKIQEQNRKTKLSKMKIDGHSSPIIALAQCSKTNRLWSGSHDKTIKEWRVGPENDGACIRTLEGHSNWIQALAQCPKTNRLWSGSDDATIKEWRVGLDADGACVRTLQGHSSPIRRMIKCPKTSRLWSGSMDKTIKEWRVGLEDDGACVRTLEGHSGQIFALAQCPKTKRLWSGSTDATVKEWLVGPEDDGACVRTLEGHSISIIALAQCPKTKRLWSGSYDKTIKEWRVGLEDDCVCVRTLQGHSNTIRALAQCPKTNRLWSGSDDATIKEWRVGLEEDGAEAGYQRIFHI